MSDWPKDVADDDLVRQLVRVFNLMSQSKDLDPGVRGLLYTRRSELYL